MKHWNFFSSFFKFGQRCQLHIFCMAGEGDTLQFSLLFFSSTIYNLTKYATKSPRQMPYRVSSPGPLPRPCACNTPLAPPKGSHGHNSLAYVKLWRPSSAPAAPQCSGPGGAAVPLYYRIHTGTDFLFLLRTLNRKVCSRRASDVQSYRFIYW